MKKILYPLVFALLIISSFAQDSGALIDALIRKGILTNQEAEDIRVELVRENNTIPSQAMAGGKSTDRLSVGMRMQLQYANLSTDVNGGTKPTYTDQFFNRRIYFTLKASVGSGWGATMTYDFASGGYDDAIIEYKPTPDLNFNFGLRKVNVAYEERATSGNLRSIERSGVTRYFVESNNGRRLGAASYRVGAFFDGKKELTNKFGLVYSAAVTNPQRDETFAGASSAGNAGNNKKAYWGNIGFTSKLPENGSAIIGYGTGILPDQGGFGVSNIGKGYDLIIHSIYIDVAYLKYTFMAEYLRANVDKGAGNNDANPYGWFVQPTMYLTDSFEIVFRYQQLDTDNRGVNLSDVVRSAPSSANMNLFNEYYVGVNWYIRGQDMKFQLGALTGEAKNSISNATTHGVRSQLQVQF